MKHGVVGVKLIIRKLSSPTCTLSYIVILCIKYDQISYLCYRLFNCFYLVYVLYLFYLLPLHVLFLNYLWYFIHIPMCLVLKSSIKELLCKSADSSSTCMEFHLNFIWMHVIILTHSATAKTNLHSSKWLGKHNL